MAKAALDFCVSEDGTNLSIQFFYYFGGRILRCCEPIPRRAFVTWQKLGDGRKVRQGFPPLKRTHGQGTYPARLKKFDRGG
jgi:hypothetical protein